MTIIIPAFEPDEKLLSLIQNIQDNNEYEIVIVDDGSSIECKDLFKKANELGCTILIHKSNQGKGAALKTAFSYLLHSKEEEGIVCADCDGQHTWQDIKKISDAIPYHKDAIILGCREFIGKVPIRSLIGNRITGSIFSILANSKVSDTQTGLRGFSVQMLPWLMTLNGDRYEYEMNQLLEAKSAGYQLHSISIQTIYENNNAGSHFHPVKDSIRIYLPIIKFSLSSISCGIIDFAALFLLNVLSQNLFFSVVTARLFSSLCNYFLNKNIVFKSKDQKHNLAILKYYALVIVILICNYLLMNFFVNTTGFSLVIGKLLTECILFLFSYIIQHKFVF